MLSLFSAFVAATSVAVSAPVAQGPAAGPPVRIVMNGTDFTPGDRVRVQVETGEDGYLVVFRVDGDGRIRVLFPLDPDLDAFVRGGKRYELRGRTQRETFLADDRDGTGIIYAALSREPLAFGAFAVNDHWDYDALRLRDSSYDAEADLAAIVRRMSDNGRFDYDVVGYRVNDGRVVAVAGRGYGDPFYDPYWDCLSCGWGRSTVDVHFGIGSRWNRYGGWYDPRWGDPFYYDPFYWDSYYWGSSWWNYPGQRRPITVVNLPRPPIHASTPYGARPRQGTSIPSTVPGAFRPDVPTRVVRPEPRNGTAPSDRGYGSRGRGDDRGSPSRPSNQGNDRPSERRNDPPPSTRPASPPPSNQGGENRGNARRRPNDGLNEVVRTILPTPERRPEESAPIYREPRREPQVERSRPEPREQPVYREPPRVERPAERPAERPSSPPPSAPRVERPSSPPPSAPSAPRNEGGGARRRPG